MNENNNPLQKVDTQALTALQYSQYILNEAAKTGFDWPNWQPVIDKIHEEMAEVIEAVENKEGHQRIEEELGDLIIIIVNLARHLNIDAEEATKKANEKFERRYNQMLSATKMLYPEKDSHTLEEMDHAWNHVKALEKSNTQS